ncbi:MAG: DNA-binding protein [Firmicutes bacterium]|nr:DNA-binding protein [Bacillota bacterium]
MPTCRELNGCVPCVLSLGPGADLFAELRSFMAEGRWTEAIVLGAAGSFDLAQVCYPRDATLPPVVERITLEGVFEISSLSGNVVVREGQAHVHLHGSFAEQGQKVYGGALGDGTRVFKMADLFLLSKR